MTDIQSTRARVVLTRAGRAWVQARLDRASKRLSQVGDEFSKERSGELLEERQRLTAQMEELEGLLSEAVAPADVSDDPSIVELGDEVEIEFPDRSRESFLIVHPVEAGMDEHRMSSDSPLARAVLGQRPGERVTVQTPAGVYGCTIVHRERIG